eukprot:CAMPEP_0174247254 /NCGR_PEP_ID=MMETSP0417-20130205/42482_1 /TAXON_ID=242541 /ORGANISM="Mayorella sp, Strain BSH-02190019" /LENGTH=372 /DNA_ID=CAMNT_0015327111 /DNA_START=137 /DNA_END=1253 /DNA_ORIENTATION=-
MSTTTTRKPTTSFPKGPERQRQVLRILLRDIDAPLCESKVAALPQGVQKRVRNHRSKRATNPAFVSKFTERAREKLSQSPQRHGSPAAVHRHRRGPHSPLCTLRTRRGSVRSTRERDAVAAPRQHHRGQQRALRVLVRDIQCGLHDEEFAELPTPLQMRVLKHRELRAQRPHFQAKFLARAQRQLEPETPVDQTSTVDQPSISSSTTTSAPKAKQAALRDQTSTVDQPSISSSTTTSAPKAKPSRPAHKENLRSLLRSLAVSLSEEEINNLPQFLSEPVRKLRQKHEKHCEERATDPAQKTNITPSASTTTTTTTTTAAATTPVSTRPQGCRLRGRHMARLGLIHRTLVCQTKPSLSRVMRPHPRRFRRFVT